MFTDVPLIGHRYQLHEQLGAGGMGAVYRATDRLTGQTLALKRVLLNPVHTDEMDTLRLSMAQEFRSLASLRHPNIISVLDYGFDSQRQPYFTMDLLTSPRSITEAAANTDTSEKIRLLLEMLNALAYLHRRGIIHRDLKPANVMVTTSGRVRVVDFGLALDQTQAVQQMSSGLSGTIAYMSPELFLGKAVSVASDLYAVGVIAYEMFAGHHPYPTDNMSLLLNHILNSLPDLSMLDESLAWTIDRLLSKDPYDRYASAEDTIDALCGAVGQPPPEETTEVRESFLQASRFVGRETELVTLTQALAAALEGRGSAWMVGGESGVGKSRLLDELRTQALIRGALVLRGQAVEGGGLPYQLWRDAVKRLALSTPLNDLEASVLKTVLPEIGELLGREIADAPEVSSEAARQRLVQAILELLKAQTEPLVFILEDLHWSSESLEVLEALVRFVPQFPWMVIISYRDDEAPELPQKLPQMQSMRLSRLSTTAIAELSAAMLGYAGQQPHVIELLQRETEGNVFFLVEVVRSLAEEAGGLGGVGWITLPRSITAGGIQNIARRRLRRVPNWAKPLLKLAAVAGRQINPDVLKATAVADQLEEWLIACANVAVLEAVEGGWRFAHDKLRETLLADLNPSERPMLHRTIAEAIESVYPNDTGYGEILLEHWFSAGDNAKTVLYTLQVARRLVKFTADYPHAQHILERALTLDHPAVDAARADLLTLLGDTAERQVHYPAALEHYQDALSHVQPYTPLHVRILNGMSKVASAQKRFAEAEQAAREGLEIARAIDDSAGIALSLTNLGNSQLSQKQYESAVGYHRESLTIYRVLGDQWGIAASLNNLGNAAQTRAHYEEARQYYLQGLDILRALDERRGITMNLRNLGANAWARGQYEERRGYLEEYLHLAKQIGHPDSIAKALIHLGENHFIQEDYDSAQTVTEEALYLTRLHEYNELMSTCLLNLGTIAHVAGALSSAQDYYLEALALRRAQGNKESLINILYYLGFFHITCDDTEQAYQMLSEAERVSREINSRSLPVCISGLAMVYTHRQQPDAAQQLLVEALPLLKSPTKPLSIGRFLLAAAYFVLKQGRTAEAAQWAGLVASNLKLLDEARPTLNWLNDQLRAVLGPTAFAQHTAQGASLDADALLRQLVIQMGQGE